MENQDLESLRSRARELLPQAEALIVRSPLTPRPPTADTRTDTDTSTTLADDAAHFDQTLDALAEIEAALSSAADQDLTLLGEVQVALGSLYATRYIKARGTDADRAEGIRLLRAARAAGSARTEVEPNPTMLLATLLLNATPPNGAQSLGDLRTLILLGSQVATGGPHAQDLREARSLVGEVLSARADDPQVAPLALLVNGIDQLFALPLLARDGYGDSIAQLHTIIGNLSSIVPEHIADQMNSLMSLAEPLAAVPEPEQSRPITPAPSPGPADDEPLIDSLIMLLETTAPGTVPEAELADLIDRLERAGAAGDSRSAALAALARLVLATRTGDPVDLDRTVHAFQELTAGPRTSEDSSWLARSVFPAALAMAAMTSGNRQDAERAAEQLDLVWPSPTSDGRTPAEHAPGLTALRTGRVLLRAHLGAARAWEAEDAEALDQLVSELTDIVEASDTAGEWRCMLRYQLAVTKLYSAALREHDGLLREALADLHTALETSTPLPFVRPLLEATWPAALALSSLLERQPAQLAEAVSRARASLAQRPVASDQHTYTRLGIALALKAQWALLDEPAKSAALREAIDELEQARAMLTEHSGTGVAGRVLWELAQARRLSGTPNPDHDGDAVTLALESMHLVADDVLLQFGAEHGLQAARAAAGRGLRAASWALAQDRVQDAVQCLETGRALVLRACAASRSVPDRLRTAGAPDLADQWERAFSVERGEPSLPAHEIMRTLVMGDDMRVPSELRRRALSVLRAADENPPHSALPPHAAWTQSGIPDLRELMDTVGEAGLDALVYIIPSDDGDDGRALIIRGDGAVRNVILPALSPTGRLPFDAYMESCAQRSKLLRGAAEKRDIAAGQPWAGDLERLCTWAGPIIGTVLSNLPVEPTLDNPARVVLVPCGTLGVVPWAAARLPSSPAGNRTRPVHACDLLVMSYAASGGQLVHSLHRDRAQYDANPVLVVDPSRTLRFAGNEAAAIRRAFLPGARILGFAEDLPCEAPGTPQEVLAAFSGDGDGLPASMLQITAHGTASTRPTTSRLLLADPTADPATAVPPDGVGAMHLTVERVLAAPPFEGPSAAGPLVVLDCCDTDLSDRDHDEAMTLTSAFVAQGAADAVGSRWSIDDWSAAVCMVAFHHYLATANLAPPDALRAAQLWMLGPERERIPALEDDLLRRGRHPLDAISAWGAFIHQGNPRPRRGEQEAA